MSEFKPSFLLHACCATCAVYIIEKLKGEFDLTVYYYNPNIHPEEEYLNRRNEIARYCELNKIDFVEDDYNTEKWFEKTKGLEHEPERGKRCLHCFWLRLDKTADYADSFGFDFFATTLSISPHKVSKVINDIGHDLAGEYGIGFYDEDFKKKDGFKKALVLASQYNFYRQDYCGCLYSKRDREKNLK